MRPDWPAGPAPVSVNIVRPFIAAFLALVEAAASLSAQEQAPPGSCCRRVEVIANRSSGFGDVPEYMSVWIEPSSRLWAFEPAFVNEAREAFGTWVDAGVPVVFDFTNDSTSAMIRVIWTNRFRDPVAGRSTWWTADGRLGRVDIEVALTAQPGVDARIVRAIVMHEIGHLLGFSHSKEPDSIMSYYVSRPELSQRDLARMRTRFALRLDER